MSSLSPPAHSVRPDAGFSMLEVLVAFAILATSIMYAFTTIGQSSALDHELAQREIALRAAHAQVEALISFDHEGDVQNFVDYWTDPANANFEVEGLEPVPPADPLAAQFPNVGRIDVDASDPQRVRVDVRLAWEHLGTGRTLGIPTTVTEILR